MNFKAKFRAWLIDLVREAIRAEYTAQRLRENSPQSKNPDIVQISNAGILPLVTGSYTFTLEPSFEQMQSEALQAQEKFYAPERK